MIIVVSAGMKLIVVTSPGVPVIVVMMNGEVERVTVSVSSSARRPRSAEADVSVRPWCIRNMSKYNGDQYLQNT